jgi:hypothetical protein
MLYMGQTENACKVRGRTGENDGQAVFGADARAGSELKRLQEEFSASLVRAGEACRAYGMDSPEFLKADAETSAIKRRIAEIEGAGGK